MPSATQTNQLLVFLSYAREDETIVRELYKRLQAEGFDPWMDQECLLPGQDWEYEIKQAMGRCDAILLCFSEKSLSKVGYIQREYKKAMKLQKYRPPGIIFVIPVRLDDCTMPPYLNSLQRVDFPPGFEKLVQALHVVEKQLGANTHGRPIAAQADSSATVITVAGGTGGEITITGSGDTVIQVIIRIFNLDDLNRLVLDSFQKPGELQNILANTFPAGAAGPGVQGFTSEFIRNHEIARLLGEIKKRNPSGYRDFLAAKSLGTIGLLPREIPPVETDAKIIEAELLGLQQAAIARQSLDLDDSLEFENRDDWFRQIRFDGEDHFVLHGPNGAGKSHFLKQLQKRYENDTCCVLIDLSDCKPGEILWRALQQLGVETKPANEYQVLARCIHDRLSGAPQIRRFYFLFDNCDHNQAAIDYLFSPESIIENPRLLRLLRDWGLAGRVDLKIVIAARQPVETEKIYPTYNSKTSQIKINPLRRHHVQNMLEKIVDRRKIPVGLDRIKDLSDEVYYLTGGHPKCVKQMLGALAEQGCMLPTADEWIQLYKQYVIATIHAEMLQPVDRSLFSTIWNLSIFRRFDQRLLGGLLDRGILPSAPGDISRQARELRTRLVNTNLFDAEKETSTTLTNYVMRHALSLNLQLDAPGRYKALHAVALQMYLDRLLSSEAGPDKWIERQALNLLELLYHWTRLLEVEPQLEQTRPACERIREAFEDHLLLAMSMMREAERPEFFQALKARWDADEELREAVRRSTPQEDCLAALQGVFQKYEPIPEGLD